MPYDRTKSGPTSKQIKKLKNDDAFYKAGPLKSTFLVVVDDKPIGRFTEVNGLEVSIEVETIQEGGQNGFEHKLPGRMTWPNITLKRGVTQSDTLLAWIEECSGDGYAGAKNKLKRKTMGITMLSAAGEPLREWSVEAAFPIKWTGPSFASSDDDVLTEELEIAHHGFRAETF